MSADHLSSRLVLVDGQHGFVGETGTVTTIEPDGSFTVAEFVKDRVDPPKRTGKLPPEAMARLARTVSAELSPDLPQSVGQAKGANPRRLRIDYGSSAVTLTLPPPGAPEPAPEGDDDAARVLRIEQVVREVVGAP